MAVSTNNSISALSFSSSLSTPPISGEARVAAPPAWSKKLAVSCSLSDDSSAAANDAAPLSASRRHSLLAIAGASTAPLWSPLLLPSEASAADLIQRSQRADFQKKLKLAVKAEIDANQDLVPDLLRLAINDAATYDKASKTGGANGSIRFAEELSRPENAGLQAALSLLERVKAQVDDGAKGGPISNADLIQFGASGAVKRSFFNAAIRKAGGDEEKGASLFRAIGSSGQWGLFDKQFGRSDAAAADPAGGVLNWEAASTEELKARLGELGVKPRQITVLGIFLARDLEAFEEKLAADPEFAPWVAKYQKSRKTTSQTDYEVDLINAFAKFSTLGAPINYEAYSFAVERKPLKL